jgi:peptidoglycan/LPS O-acetylase OafA/YrhL
MSSVRFNVLDGWRGISILLVLACHLLPIGPSFLHLNFAVGVLGMALFFTLSGFLVTHFLIGRPYVIDFLIRRFLRILPLAWLYIFIALLLYPATREAWLAHLFFYANYLPKPLIYHVTDHFWSLCVEMHFYLGLALIVSLFKKKGLLLIPVLCVFVTLLRVVNSQHASVITHFRVDEILAGGILALIYNRQLGDSLIKALSKVSYIYVLVLLLVSCHENAGFMNYFRPYLAATLVGATLYNQNTRFAKLLEHKWLFYIASISYALYIIHPLLASSWLGSGDLIEKYSKRPLLFAVLFLLAHLSTFYYEQRVMAWGKAATLKLKFARLR